MIQKSIEQIEKARNRKDLKELFDAIKSIKASVNSISFGDVIDIACKYDEDIEKIAKSLMPWRKGPFKINDLFIDSEWRSYFKYNFLKPHFDLKGKKVADIGANNGYYSFRMGSLDPASITIFEPYPLFMAQFEFLDRFVGSKIRFELLGVEDLNEYGEKFDIIFCLGVVYHRTDPIGALRALKKGLAENGELFVDCLIIEGDEDMALCPYESYAKMTNAYFIPTKRAFEGWIRRAGFGQVEFLGQMPTTTDEQRKSDWIGGLSLGSFLNTDGSKTIEGYPPPLRAYYKVKI
jgi:tRNA (mo5U34)-methyltransferase